MNKSNKNIAVAIIAALSMGSISGGAFAGGLLSAEFQNAEFDSMEIHNRYWPLYPEIGVQTTFVYLGETEDGCVFNKITVDPGDTKTFSDSEAGYEYYNGFVAQVVVDREWELEDTDCEDLIEALEMDSDYEPEEEDIGEWTLDWYRQDVNGNIWYLGEYSQHFEDLSDEGGSNCAEIPFQPDGAGVPLDCTEGSWESGQLGQEEGEIVGESGIVVPGDNPTGNGLIKPGTYWMQEVAEGAEDMAKLLRTNASVSIEEGQFAGDYDNCRKVKEWTALEPGHSVEHKYYCPTPDGPGLILIQGIGGGPTESEVLMLATP